MKLTFEVGGYTITIDETEEGISVSALNADEEVVEEFTLETEGEDSDMDDEGGEDLDMDDEGGEDIGGQELPDEGAPIDGAQEEDFPAQAQAQLGESKIHNFGAFLKRK